MLSRRAVAAVSVISLSWTLPALAVEATKARRASDAIVSISKTCLCAETTLQDSDVQVLLATTVAVATAAFAAVDFIVSGSRKELEGKLASKSELEGKLKELEGKLANKSEQLEGKLKELEGKLTNELQELKEQQRSTLPGLALAVGVIVGAMVLLQSAKA